NATTRKDDEQSRRTVTITTEDMQRKKNDVKARTTLLLSLPDEHQIWPLFLPQRTAIKMAILQVLPLLALPFPLMGHFARECRAPESQERGRKESYRQGTKAEEKTPKALIAIDGVGWD
nr:hypothetical protein [Tanacetum cinerariifolium]